MNQPKKFTPIEASLEVGREYYWCACGRSQSQPFCDGSHKGTDFVPKRFSVEESKSYWLCTCKKTGKPLDKTTGTC